MSTIEIGGNSRTLQEAEPRWITDQVNARLRAGAPVCVRVSLRTGGANMTLSTSACGGRGGGGWSPNRLESQIHEVWKRLGLGDPDLDAGRVVAFVQQLRRLL